MTVITRGGQSARPKFGLIAAIKVFQSTFEKGTYMQKSLISNGECQKNQKYLFALLASLGILEIAPLLYCCYSTIECSSDEPANLKNLFLLVTVSRAVTITSFLRKRMLSIFRF